MEALITYLEDNKFKTTNITDTVNNKLMPYFCQICMQDPKIIYYFRKQDNTEIIFNELKSNINCNYCFLNKDIHLCVKIDDTFNKVLFDTYIINRTTEKKIIDTEKVIKDIIEYRKDHLFVDVTEALEENEIKLDKILHHDKILYFKNTKKTNLLYKHIQQCNYTHCFFYKTSMVFINIDCEFNEKLKNIIDKLINSSLSSEDGIIKKIN